MAKIAQALGVSVDDITLRAASYANPGEPVTPRGVGGRVRRVAFGSLSESNRQDQDMITEIVAARTNRAQDQLEALEGELEEASRRFLLPFLALADEMEGAPQPEQTTLADSEDLETMSAAEFESYSRARAADSLAQLLSKGAVGGLAGGAVGAGAALGAFTAVGLWGTASTGTAIATLSGIAATNATLAALGGGALSAGGLGIAGGTLVLGSIVAAPLLIATGVTAVIAGRKARVRDH